MLNKHFQEFIELLENRGVRYLIVGGYAVGLHGFPRYTGDLIELEPKMTFNPSVCSWTTRPVPTSLRNGVAPCLQSIPSQWRPSLSLSPS